MDAAAPIVIVGKYEVKPEWMTADEYFDVKLDRPSCYGQRFYLKRKPNCGNRRKSKRGAALLQRQLVKDLAKQGLL